VRTVGNLLAVSDLHVGHKANRDVLRSLRPETDEDWLIVAGDVAERVEHVEWALKILTHYFAKVIWAPGNHELWTPAKDRTGLRGVARYKELIERCRALGVVTPEDEFPTWAPDHGDPVVVAPLFTLYDYSFRAPGTTAEEALAHAYDTGVVCTDEALLHPDPYPDRASWCRARIAESARRLDAIPADLRTVLVSHWPLHRGPTLRLRYPEFAQWCGTTLTADWHVRYRAAVAVYGHLHIPLPDEYDGVPFQEVSLGYPREWQARKSAPVLPRRILPRPAGAARSNAHF
jgi:3',5'-cyclic AMP phosphodiesterase CpdA